MHIKINFTKILQSFVLVSGLGFMLVLSLPGLASAQANNPFTQPVNQDQATENAINQAINNKKNSVPAKDRNAAASPYCKGYYLDLGTYEGSKLQACVTGVLQKLSGVNGNYPSTDAPCMKYSSDLGGGAGDITHKYGICMVGYNAVPVTNANKASFLGGNNASDIKNQAKRDAEDAQASASSNSDDQVNCDANGSPLSWIACPLIDAGAGMTDYIFNNFVQPLLENVPISADSKDGSFLAWQTFRIFGNAILVGSLLVMVFAQNFGRFVDAYTIRKMAPRIVIGAIAINISFYLCLAAIDIVNVIGNGLNQALTAPFIDENTFKEGIPIDSSAANNITGVLGLGLLGAAAAVIFTSVATIGVLGIISLMLPLILTVALISLAVLFTIIIRQALLIFLTAISAVAIACFILPGTEKYFRQWWDLFLKALMVYPIIAVIFAMSNVMASIILRSAGGGALGTAQIITAILVVYAPLVLIPFAFKFAGGAIGSLMDVAGKRAQGISARASESGTIKGRREFYGQKLSDARLQRKAQRYRNLKGRADRGNKLAAFGSRYMAGYANDIESREAEMQGRVGELFNKTIATGDDTMIRAYTANLRQADRDRKNGVGAGETWREGENGLEVRTAAGKWVSRESALQARQRWGEDSTASYQAALSYEMRKATSQEEQDRLISSFATGAGERGLTSDQANGVWIGAAFANQNENRQWKYNSWQRDANGGFSHKINGLGLMTEIDEKQGSYASSMQSADTWSTMAQEVNRAHEVLAGQREGNAQEAREVVVRASRIAESLSGGGYTTQDPETGEVRQITGSGAPGRVGEEMRAFTEVAKAAGGFHDFQGQHYGTPTRTPNPMQAVEDRDRPADRGGP